MSSQPISQDMTGRWLKAIGKQLGFEHHTISYSLRYFAGNSLDQSSKFKSLYHIPLHAQPQWLPRTGTSIHTTLTSRLHIRHAINLC